jgi:hydroxymethylpyrimidine pyrophosphatase-like HAD family hydrolase
MRFHAIALDFDGTLAHDGRVSDAAIEALGALRKSGRRAILATGRIVEDLRAVFGRLDLFDAVVAENGAVLFDPATNDVRPLAPPPPGRLVEELRARGVTPLEHGRVIVATRQPQETIVLEAIRELGLDLALIFNKGAVMALPSGVNKATGLEAQLDAFHLSFHNVVGIGDAENDLRFLERCEVSVAVANALPSVKDACDVVTSGARGHGVCELIEQLIDDDLQSVGEIDRRHRVALGKLDGAPFEISAACGGVLVAGTSGGGKSTLVSGFVERLAAAGYQYLVVDPEGDYAETDGAIAVGDPDTEPNPQTVADVLLQNQNAIVSLLAIKVDDRPAFARHLVARIAEVQARFGRPHWLVVDEAHHLFPTQSRQSGGPFRSGSSTLYTTTDPRLVAKEVLTGVDVVVTVGDEAAAVLRAACAQAGSASPAIPRERIARGEAFVWRRSDPDRALTIETLPGTPHRRRHARKYAKGELAEEDSFYFTGPKRKLHLRAQNLLTFVQIAEGIDEETWTHHLRRHDYSGWIHEVVGDNELAEEVRDVENQRALHSEESRKRIAEAVRSRYTA